MPSIKKMYEVYHEKDVEVVSVSLDDNKEAWEKAYKEENIPWIDGSNLLGWKDPVALWYAIRGIPHKVLVDQHGIIVASGFHQLGSLEYKSINILIPTKTNYEKRGPYHYGPLSYLSVNKSAFSLSGVSGKVS